MKISKLEDFSKKLDYYGWEVEDTGATAVRLRGTCDRDCYTVTLDTQNEGGPDYVGVTVAHDRFGECAFRHWPLDAAMGDWINGVVDGYRTGGQVGYNLGFHVGLFHQKEAED